MREYLQTKAYENLDGLDSKKTYVVLNGVNIDKVAFETNNIDGESHQYEIPGIGPQGPQGATGATGETGPQGPQGQQGQQGTVPTNVVTSTTTGLKIEVVPEMPATPDNSTIYIVK